MRLTAAQVIAKMNWLRKIAPNAQLSADSRAPTVERNHARDGPVPAVCEHVPASRRVSDL